MGDINKKINNAKLGCKKLNLNINCYPCPVISVIGPTGATGPAGTIVSYADFYALMPPNNSATVAPATDVFFP